MLCSSGRGLAVCLAPCDPYHGLQGRAGSSELARKGMEERVSVPAGPSSLWATPSSAASHRPGSPLCQQGRTGHGEGYLCWALADIGADAEQSS